jgi:1,4-dihydroxy-2-naphthoate octaprenyltransferase
MTFPFLFLFFLLGSQEIPFQVLLSFLALPLAIKAIRTFWNSYATYEQIISAQALTIQTHMTLGILMVAGILIGHFSGKA